MNGNRQIIGFAIQNREGFLQGLDHPSGGYPYNAFGPQDVKVWHEQGDAVSWHRVINYGDKGYAVVRVRVTVEII